MDDLPVKWVDAAAMPSKYTALVERICDYMVETGTPLPKICKEKLVGPDTPKLTTLYWWARRDAALASALHAARQAAADARWTELGQQIEAEFDAAIQVGDKATMMATEKKMALLFKYRQFEVQKLIPALYGSKSSDAPPPAQAQEGTAVVERVIEIPAKNHAKPIDVEAEVVEDEGPRVLNIAGKRRR